MIVGRETKRWQDRKNQGRRATRYCCDWTTPLEIHLSSSWGVRATQSAQDLPLGIADPRYADVGSNRNVIKMVKEVVIKAVMNYPGRGTESDEIFVFLGVCLTCSRSLGTPMKINIQCFRMQDHGLRPRS